ncbi:T9SS type A sorting domain-containing protein [Winogradskyella sp. UBA3174]|uniref:T9SS type A sorting domain-containing protein n=1 Tax=Winogradskyella sp. UBA3174 TaxID=1947785 RepID=UPI0025E9069F|nr:T9SS type A sorting domain-containing protein [Winogradskyella sp. UBA3174]
MSIENISKSEAFNIYPNPSTDKQIKLVYDVNTLSLDNNDVSIYSTTGQKVFQNTLSSNLGFQSKLLDLSSLSSGIYLLRFTSGEFTTNIKINLK